MDSASRRHPTGGPRAPQRPASTTRLQRVLAAAGLGSRRQCEELILTGRVEVDRRVVTELGTRVDPGRQEIRVDGESLPKTRLLYFLLNKPPGVVSTNRDPAGRPRVIDLIPSRDQRLFAVGRLDMSSEGLMLVTNDGELANRLMHPRYEVEKTYQVEVAGQIERSELARLEHGVHLAEGRARAIRAELKKVRPKSSVLEIVLREGKNREIRRMLARSGHKVLRLKRIALGPLRLGDLPRGECRPLSRAEVRLLERAARGLDQPRREARQPAKRSARPAGGPKPGRREGKPPAEGSVSGAAGRTIIGLAGSAAEKSGAAQAGERRGKQGRHGGPRRPRKGRRR